MFENDAILYCGFKYPKLYRNTNLAIAIQCIACKYGLTCKIGKREIPKMKEAQRYIQKRCFEDFRVKISLKQFSYLLRPQKGKFPYTAIVMIETIYNLLKEDNGNTGWEVEFVKYLSTRSQNQVKYEEFLLGDISKAISIKVDDFMNSVYREIYTCFMDSRQKYRDKFEDVSMKEHCNRNFPSDFFTKDDMADSMFNYQIQQIYMKVGRNGTFNKKY